MPLQAAKHQLLYTNDVRPINDWIQDHQEITHDSLDCLPQADLGGFGPA